MLEPRAPWQTRFARVPVALPPSRPVQPIAIPVIGGRAIAGERLIRAPWAEPLAAFAGVVVETQRVPQGWLAGPPRPSAPRDGAPARSARAVAIPVMAAGPTADRPIPFVPPTRRSVDGLVAIPVAPRGAPGIAVADARPLPGRIIPFPIAPAPEPAAAAVLAPAAVAVAVLEAPEPAAPASPAPAPGPAGRRGFLARTLTLSLTMLASFAALESLTRIGRR
ncbi:MAG: hypothetical protein U0869_02180 [Chloroflexota bacterium]